jgi:ADP-ribose pyrophosphatase YjhB (NUDIX family)
MATSGEELISAGAVIIEADGRIWLFEPTNHYRGYKYTFPKGRVEDGFSLRAAAAKEVFEETGLLVRIGRFLIDVKRTHTRTRYYLAERIAGTPSDMGWEAQAVLLVPRALVREFALSPPDQLVANASEAVAVQV